MNFENVGWIVEARIREGQRLEFEVVMNDLVAATDQEPGTLDYQYFVSDDGDLLVYERFRDVASAHAHLDLWEEFAERWLAAAEPTRLVHLGDLPEDLRVRHAALSPEWLRPWSGFKKQ